MQRAFARAQSSTASDARPASAPLAAASPASSAAVSSEHMAALHAEHERKLAAQKAHLTELAQQAFQKGVAQTAAEYEIKLKQVRLAAVFLFETRPLCPLVAARRALIFAMQTREAAELTHELDLHDTEQRRLAALQAAIERMKVPVTAKPTLVPVACAAAREAVEQCLRASGRQKSDPLACRAVTQAFIDCSKNTIASAVA